MHYLFFLHQFQLRIILCCRALCPGPWHLCSVEKDKNLFTLLQLVPITKASVTGHRTWETFDSHFRSLKRFQNWVVQMGPSQQLASTNLFFCADIQIFRWFLQIFDVKRIVDQQCLELDRPQKTKILRSGRFTGSSRFLPIFLKANFRTLDYLIESHFTDNLCPFSKWN